MVSDVRGGRLLRGAREGPGRAASSAGIPHRLLYLDASEDVLVNRYKETRARHPLANGDGQLAEDEEGPVGGAVAAAIIAERELLEPLRERADVSIDTSDLSASRLRKVVADKMLPRGSVGKLAVTFLTYGFKHGAPRDADLLFDVRFLPNPHYEADLRPLTGLDEPVREYVEGSDGIDDFYGHLIPLLDYLLPQYESEGKAHLTIGDRLHRRPPPLGGDRRAPGARVRRARRPTWWTWCTATSTSRRAAPEAHA